MKRIFVIVLLYTKSLLIAGPSTRNRQSSVSIGGCNKPIKVLVNLFFDSVENPKLRKKQRKKFLLCFRIYEGDPIKVMSLREAEYHEQVLKETINRVQLLKVKILRLSCFIF